MLSLVVAPQISARSRHIELVHHLIRQLHTREVIYLVHVVAKDMRADMMTKLLPKGLFLAARTNLFCLTAVL